MQNKRASGLLVHLTSLPSPYGIGDLGPDAYRFIDFLADSGQSYWQFLPTGPTEGHFGHSPYMSLSAFAGTPLLISPELLRREGYIGRSQTDDLPQFSPYFTEFAKVEPYKKELLHHAYRQFCQAPPEEFKQFQQNAPWLDDYALYMTIKQLHRGKGWNAWPEDLAQKKTFALQEIEHDHWHTVNYFQFEQFIFHQQWEKLQQYATAKNIALFGDLPIYVSYDSADVWANQHIFALNETTHKPELVAGVPPDYFSDTGQRWGNPLYNWHSSEESVIRDLYHWWTARFKHLFSLVDLARIDHFRGFESYFAIPAHQQTAREGEWLPGPGKKLFESIFTELGPLAIIAEDLGIITTEVEQLRDELGFPGMKILQFAFDGDPENLYLPWNFTTPNCIVYTGTHDNDTTVGWYLSEHLSDTRRQEIKMMVNRDPNDQRSIHQDLIHLAQSSIASLCIFPLQDVLGFGSDCRMNRPGTLEGNWTWRCAAEFLTDHISTGLREITERFGRAGKTSEESATTMEKRVSNP